MLVRGKYGAFEVSEACGAYSSPWKDGRHTSNSHTRDVKMGIYAFEATSSIFKPVQTRAWV